MKNLILLFCFLITTLSVNADYVPIPTQYTKVYHTEIQNEINTQVPIIIKNINQIEKDIKKENNVHIKNTLIENGISGELLKFYLDLLKITDKYVNISDSIPATDWYEELDKILKPYFRGCNINSLKFKYLLMYAHFKQYRFEKYRTKS